MYCSQCGNPLPEDAKFCDRCGAKVENAAPPEAAAKGAPEPDQKRPKPDYRKKSCYPDLVGYSDACQSPEILAFKEEKKKSSMGCMIFISFLPVIGLGLLGLFGWMNGENSLELALTLAGFGLIPTAVMLIFILIRKAASRREKPGWEGVVIDKKVTEERDRHKEKHSSESGPYYYKLYKIYVRTDDGSKKSFAETDSPGFYNYYQVGDRVRYHPGLEYYEKYDKSHDSYIYCACCKTRNPIENDTCKNCGRPLFK